MLWLILRCSRFLTAVCVAESVAVSDLDRLRIRLQYTRKMCMLVTLLGAIQNFLTVASIKEKKIAMPRSICVNFQKVFWQGHFLDFKN